MDKNTSKLVKNSVRMKVLQQLGLLAAQDTKIEMISGGEKRKLSLATEVLNLIIFRLFSYFKDPCF